MSKKNKFKVFLISLSIFFITFKYLNLSKENFNNDELKIDKSTNKTLDNEEETYFSNFIKDVRYNSIDQKGNLYIIEAESGEIDINKSNVIFLRKIKASVQLKNSNKIEIFSDFGKYNTDNYNTIFSRNVLVKYLDSIIEAEYMDLSILKNFMTISKNVIYKNNQNIVKADVIEMIIDSKDTKIFMYDSKKKVNVTNIKKENEYN